MKDQTYIEVWLKPLVSTLKEQRPLNGSKNLKFYHFNARPHVQKDVKKYLETQNLVVSRGSKNVVSFFLKLQSSFLVDHPK